MLVVEKGGFVVKPDLEKRLGFSFTVHKIFLYSGCK